MDVYGVTACQVDMVADGLNDGRFGPGLAVNRSQFAKMVVDGFGLPKHAPFTPSFNDVGAAHFFFEWIKEPQHSTLCLVTKTVVSDRRSITRQQACSILGRPWRSRKWGSPDLYGVNSAATLPWNNGTRPRESPSSLPLPTPGGSSPYMRPTPLICCTTK